MNIQCYAAMAKNQALEKYQYTPEPLKPYDIEVNITHCGICRSDLHLIDNDWETSIYPLVPGHEIIGKIAKIGDAVQELQVGQRVGIGWQRSSCMHCGWCNQGEENLCFKQEATCVGHPGGFAQAIRADSRFAFPIPDELSSEHAAPLLCGGVTVFSPLLEYVRPTSRVGIIGIGGLGHMAVQFARAFGCEVTAFSSSPDKKKEAEELGAHYFISSKDENALKKAANSFDFILSTVAVSLDWLVYLNTLKPKGILCFVGAVPKPLQIPVFSLLVGRKSICGSNIGSRPDIKQMLRFAALNGIKAQVEVFPMEEANAAITKLRQGKVRYRPVLKN